ncbi:SsgA family sporulation/cell division regulator [Sphaerisporangium viridialbum]|uniref:SsgA family sporulation/cell division regulator n=1 Tax=Sphaerisporangium viridialbum TaxID=46189 RepID=UPI003C774D93
MSTETERTGVTERGCYVPMWDDTTEEFHNGWVTYRPDVDPFFVDIEIEDWPMPVVAPRAVLQEGLDGMSVSSSLRACPSTDSRFTLWAVYEGGTAVALFRVPQRTAAQHLNGLYELVPAGEEMQRVDWDGVCAALLPPS